MTTAQFLAAIPQLVTTKGPDWALAEIAEWKRLERGVGAHGTSPEEWAALARVEVELRQKAEVPVRRRR